MSERILQVVEEVKQAAAAVGYLSNCYDKAKATAEEAFDAYTAGKLMLEEVERRLKGIIYQETQT